MVTTCSAGDETFLKRLPMVASPCFNRISRQGPQRSVRDSRTFVLLAQTVPEVSALASQQPACIWSADLTTTWPSSPKHHANATASAPLIPTRAANSKQPMILGKTFCIALLVSVHPETPDGHSEVFELETRSFSSWQGNQGLARRRTSVRRTSKPAD